MSPEIIRTPPLTAAENMEMDAALLRSLEGNPRPLLHFYNWKGTSATHGYFMDPSLYMKSGRGLNLARRPTGGGMIFHHCDFAFAVLLPALHEGYSTNTLANYAFVNDAVLKAVQAFDEVSPALLQSECRKGGCSEFCMAKPTIYDVMIEGRKVGGGAQRRTKHGLLHQGTIALALPTRQFLAEHLIGGDSLYEEMQGNSRPLLGADYSAEQFHESSKRMEALLIQELSRGFT